MVADTFDLDAAWLQEVMPEGLPVGETTVVSGPGGSGKPLLGLSIVSDWLAAGGSVVVVLTNSGRTFVDETMAELYDIDPREADIDIAWVDFDPEQEPSVDAIEQVGPHRWRANVLDPAVWQTSIDRAAESLPGDGPGTLVFGVALNLLLFSPTYQDDIREALVDTAAGQTDRTVLLTVSTSAFADQIGTVEDAADTVLMAAMEDEHLQLRGVRSDSVSVATDPVDVPFTPEELGRVKEIAEANRDKLIPTIKGI